MLPGKVIAMCGCSWNSRYIATFGGRDKFIKKELQNPYIFAGKDQQTRSAMLGQIYDLAIKANKK